jgi:hypothetical protein
MQIFFRQLRGWTCNLKLLLDRASVIFLCLHRTELMTLSYSLSFEIPPTWTGRFLNLIPQTLSVSYQSQTQGRSQVKVILLHTVSRSVCAGVRPLFGTLLYKTIIKPIWTYGIELWGCTSKSHIAKMQRSQSKILLMITNASWYVTIQILHEDLKIPFIKDVIQVKSINHHDKIGNNSNPILQPLLEQQQRRRLKKIWPANLTDGLRGFTHWMGPHNDTIGTRGRCLTQHISLKNVLNSEC